MLRLRPKASTPSKLNEFFAMGKPVVSTNLYEIDLFNKDNNHIVDIAKDSNDFSSLARDGSASSTLLMKVFLKVTSSIKIWPWKLLIKELKTKAKKIDVNIILTITANLN